MHVRPRDNRATAEIRAKVRETTLSATDFVYPMFVMEGKGVKKEIPSMPDIEKYSIDLLVEEAKKVYDLGIPSIALFPQIAEELKDPFATESKNFDGLFPQAVIALKKEIPELKIITDVAMDPYSSDGHDGVVKDGQILNDETLPILAEMALVQARAGADMVAPSDMMDGRVGYIRNVLNKNGFENVGILAYSAKYCSAFYGPFRDALESVPRIGDKKTYQMDPANAKEALVEVGLDIQEGADVVMIKPAIAYLDVIRMVKDVVNVPVAAYHVSGEYAMLKAAAARGWLDEDAAVEETLLSIKRAGADIIFSYFAKQFVENRGKS